MKIQVVLTYEISDERILELEANRVRNVLEHSPLFPQGEYSRRDLSELTVSCGVVVDPLKEHPYPHKPFNANNAGFPPHIPKNLLG